MRCADEGMEQHQVEKHDPNHKSRKLVSIVHAKSVGKTRSEEAELEGERKIDRAGNARLTRDGIESSDAHTKNCSVLFDTTPPHISLRGTVKTPVT